ncbi:alpha/beta fold hydrolase [Herbiconiux sp. KACC 21604]|uniref:alpha/beta fold hydrolase n=1 Tax=unclassified Herbiconiux TaxID=2618217 RepID=UPI00149306D5|nr:alpha/beta fold hydrolase [Herbiconiux sp. SALV-R1]QJU52842.1 alpha/beta fold hydrolase [Herbiconiux sp. SALV-R1]WPO87758.1 alpha/beta fold hydrolase [Herbiconiux sp. KACC 21604]
MDFVSSSTGGIRIAYRRTAASTPSGATAPPALLVHGTALSQAIWRGFGYLRELAVDRPVVTVDLRGHGRSDKPYGVDDYAMQRFVDDVVALLDTLELDRVHYAGYSLGGRLGFSLAAEHPQRLASFASIAGAPGTGVGVFDRVFFPGSIDALERGGVELFLEEWAAASGREVDPATRGAFLANDAAALASYMRAAEAAERVDDAAIAAFPMPVLLVAGTRDHPRLAAAEHVRALLPTAQLLLLEGADHGTTPRRPEVAPALRTFFAAVDAAP